MTTRFNVRKKVLGNLSPIRLAAKNGTAVESPAAAKVSPPTTIEPIALDTEMFGEHQIMAAHLLPGEKPALVDTGPANTAENVIAALAALGIKRLDSIVLTHVHFDHAGGAGRLAEHFPEATVYIHERAAEHLIDPTRLADSVKAIWGGKAEALFGMPTPIAADRIQTIGDGDLIDLGDRQVEAIATPGHTRAHMVFFDRSTGAMICGDALGLQLPGSRIIRPSTPPSDYSREDTISSIERLREFAPESLHLAHYGPAQQTPDATFDRAILAINEWHDSFQRKSESAESEEELLRSVNACVEATLEPVPPSVRRGFESVNPAWLNIAGMRGERDRRLRDLSDAA
ncbi:MAG TPA: MBL fold metallo-hydrolase [Solirubrobacterales bacterium]|nr:MBL fold metallo-hydrolase [Solirubrobacterales bacterium]